jgi:NADP-dependent aldehyde dehydrogenase
MGVGQFCTKPGAVIAVRGAAFNQFETRLRELMGAHPQGLLLSGGIQSNYEGALRKTARIDGLQHLLEPRESRADQRSTGVSPNLVKTSAENFLKKPELWEEIFGPHLLMVEAENYDQMLAVASALNGQLTATIHATPEETRDARPLAQVLVHKAGRIVFNGYPTGVEVCHAMQHGGPFPASTDSRFTSVGTAAIQRWVRPVCFQNFPDGLLPEELQEANPRQIARLVNGKLEL